MGATHDLANVRGVELVTDWRDRAACHGLNPDLFFSADPAVTQGAVDVCRTQCPVRGQCLVDALRRKDEHGVFGGETATARRRLLKRLARPLAEQDKATCTVGVCWRDVHCRGMCTTHYQRDRREKERLSPPKQRRGRPRNTTTCRSGKHPWTGDNIGVRNRADGHVNQFCRACKNERDREKRRLRNEAALAQYGALRE